MQCAESIYLPSDAPFVLVVADGLGGHSDGHTASQFVASEIGSRCSSCEDVGSLRDALQGINDELYMMGISLQQAKPMGCTSAGMVVHRRHALIFSVGDCSIFRMADDSIELLTTMDRASASKIKVTRSFGGIAEPERLDPNIIFLDRVSGRYLICTDGVTDVLGLEEIRKGMHCSAEQAVQLLVSNVFEGGGTDDITAIIADFPS